jgi:Exopolysaccharide biosynthesis protein YbjH
MSARYKMGLVLAILLGPIGTAGAQETPAPMVPAPVNAPDAPAPATPSPGNTPPAPDSPAPGAAGAPAGPAAAAGAPAPPPDAAPTPAAPAATMAGAATVEEGPDPLVGLLVDQGLENVVVHRDGSRIQIAYENRRYRWNVTGLGVVLAIAAREAPEDAEIVVIPKMWGVPEMRVRVAAEDYLHFLDGSLPNREFARRFSVTYSRGGAPAAGENRSFGRTDITVGPGYHASFTTEDPNEGFYPRLLPGIEGALFPGIGFSGQQSIPLSREAAKLTQARVGGVLHPVGPLFLAVDGGRLSEDMDAVQGEAGWMSRSGRTSLRMTLAAGYDYYFAENARSALLTLTQWVGHSDIAFSLVGGRFWEGDQGAELLLQSGFREHRFIIGAGHSGGVTRVHVQAILPLGPRVQPEPRTLRFKIRDDFNARYRAPNQGLLSEARVGGLAPPSLLEERTMLFSPPIIRSYLKELRRSADLLQ